MKNAALGSADNFSQFLAAVKANVTHYDPDTDPLGYYKAKSIIANGVDGLKRDASYDVKLGPEVIIQIVHDAIELFKRHVESGNLWEELWAGDSPKKERAAQIIFHALADAFCKANNVDISPEAHMGGGPIDFKFSQGYNSRVLVEMKRSMGQVKHGYEKQLEFYKAAAQTDYAIFVVINYGDLGTKLSAISDIRQKRIDTGERASDIVVIDATKKASASKRE